MKSQPITRRRKGAGMMLAMLIMAATSAIMVTMLDTITLQYTCQRNTSARDKARYLAEAGIADALDQLEQDDSWTTGIPSTQFPSGSGNTYVVTVTLPGDGTVVLNSTGTVSGVSRKVQATVDFD